jgi:Holliday junction resolvase RusA-like endonuclease
VHATIPDTIDRPFAPPLAREPIVYVLNLPVPPSVNRIWRNNGVNGTVSRAPVYKSWIKEAGMALVLDGALRGRRTIAGRFTAMIEIQRGAAQGDLDNRTKALFDLAQSMLFISNDKHLEAYTVRWVDETARGCRLTLREIVADA